MKPVNNLIGKTYGRITVISRAVNPGTRKNDTAAYWNCICTCGNTPVMRGYSLSSGKANSCGCLKREAPHLPFLPQAQPIYTSQEAAAKSAWRSRYLELSFNDFFRISQLDCFYCGRKPHLTREATRKDSSIFYYNTLDRIDNSKEHFIDNVVPACFNCNCAKLDHSIDKFYLHIQDMISNLDRVSPEEYRNNPHYYNQLIPISKLKKGELYSVEASLETFYGDGDLNLDDFYKLIMADCYYCKSIPQNKRFHYGVIYNGLDRVDSSQKHDYNNVVSCCKYCNTGKSNMTLSQFDDWIIRLSKHNRIPLIDLPNYIKSLN